MGFNWSATKRRELIRRRGTQDVRDEDAIVWPLRKSVIRTNCLSKDEQRAQAAAAFEEWQAKKSSLLTCKD